RRTVPPRRTTPSETSPPSSGTSTSSASSRYGSRSVIPDTLARAAVPDQRRAAWRPPRRRAPRSRAATARSRWTRGVEEGPGGVLGRTCGYAFADHPAVGRQQHAERVRVGPLGRVISRGIGPELHHAPPVASREQVPTSTGAVGRLDVVVRWLTPRSAVPSTPSAA